MTDLDLSAIATARTRVGAIADQLRATRLDLDRAAGALETGRGRGDDAAISAASADVARLTGSVAELVRAGRDGRRGILDAAAELVVAISPEAAVTSLSGRHPVLMLPVRVETRFFDGGHTLKVRVFPDQVHVSAHEPALTDAEVDALAWYWGQRWAEADAATPAGLVAAQQAWTGLTSRLRAGRAAFLVRRYPPVNLGSGEAAPRWDDLPRRAAQWSAAARATLLPDRWCVVGYRRVAGGALQEIFRRWGEPVPDTLAAGPSPDASAPTDADGRPDPGGLPDDPDLLWLHDAAEAERLGMLVTVTQARDVVAGADLAGGVDRLLVVGVDWTLTPQEAAAAVERHLASHADEGRLAFMPQGVPTNSTGNADGTTRTPFSTDPAVARDVLAPHAAPVAAAGAAGPLVRNALGLKGSALTGVAGADLREQDWQGALLDATWSATGGYYLTEMLDPVADDPAIEASLRHHVATHLRASGPLPTLRVGNQPYGILPVTPRDAFEPDLRRRAQGDVLRVTQALRAVVEPLVASVPTLAKVRRRDDVDDVLLALLQRMPVAWELTFRKLVGPVERRAVSIAWDRIAAFQRDITAEVLSRLQCYQLTQLSELTADGREHALRVPLVLKPDPTPQDPTHASTAYLQEIRDLLTVPSGYLALAAREDSVALLEAFLAASAPVETVKTGKAVLAQQSATLLLSEDLTRYVSTVAERVPYTLRIEDTVSRRRIDVTDDPPLPTTPIEFAQTVIPALTGQRSIGEYVAAELVRRLELPGILDVPEDPFHRLARFEAAVATLQDAPADQLEWAFRGVLDVYSTRLDAWVTSLATARLAEHRAAEPDGVHVGGWGVVEDLRPDVGPAAESLGFVHTPSLAQAASTAVMRSARLTHRDDEGRLFDLDLTSRRVRQALRILDGVSAGQRLAALLGYRIERGLQERDLRLAQWVLPLRQQAPLRNARPDSADEVEPVEVVAARDVVDGLALLDRWEKDGAGLLAAAGVAAGDASAVGAVLDEVAGLSDAVSDVLLAEAVHQATSGNLERAAAALAAHDRQGPPPESEFVRTPRGGPVLTHRAGIWLPRNATDPAIGWPADVRSAAEPRLDRWLGTVLGDPAGWTVGGRLVRADGAVGLPALTLADLGASATSLVLASRSPGDGRPSRLESLVARAYGSHPQVLALEPGPQDRLELDVDGLALFGDLAAWAVEVASAAPLSADHLASAADLRAGATAAVAVTDVAEAVGRADAVVAAASQALDAASAAVAADRAAPGDADAALLAALLALSELDDAVDPDGGLAEHVEAAAGRVQARLDAALAVPVPPPPVIEAGDVAALGVPEDGGLVRARGVVAVLLGTTQPFLPVLTPTDPAPFAASVAARGTLLADDDDAIATWLHRSALVRPALDPLAALLVHAEASGADVPAALQVLQTPHVPDGRWLALPFGETVAPVAGTVGVVLHAPEGLDPAGGGAGVVVDAWTETVPAAEETTAVTFHYDAPGARAPQVALLAVHPALDPDRWDVETLLGCAHEAMDLAKLRTVGSAELAGLSTLLPALFLPDAYTHDVPGVRLLELAKTAQFFDVGGLVGDHVSGKG